MPSTPAAPPPELGLHRKRRGATRICRATTRTSTKRARRSKSPRSSKADESKSVTPEEMAAAVAKRQEDTLARAKFFGGDPEGLIGNSAEFRDIYEITKGSRPWFVVEPRTARSRRSSRRARARIAALPRTGSFGNGPFNSHEDFSLWDRCITRGMPGSMLPGQYGNSYQIVQGPGFVAIRYEMVHDTRVIPLDGRTEGRKRDPLGHGRCTRALGRQHAGGRNHQLQGPQCLSQRQPRYAEGRGAVHAYRRRQDRMAGHGRRRRQPGRARGRSRCH